MFDTLSRWKRKASSHSPFSSSGGSGTNQSNKPKKTSLRPLHLTNPEPLNVTVDVDVEASASGSGSASGPTFRQNASITTPRRTDIQNLTISQPYPRATASPSLSVTSGTIPYAGSIHSAGNGGNGQLGGYGHELPFNPTVIMGGNNMIYGPGPDSGAGNTTIPTLQIQGPTPYLQNQVLYTGTPQQRQHQHQTHRNEIETGNELDIGTPPSRWVNAIVDSMEDNRPMGTLGRRRDHGSGHGHGRNAGVGVDTGSGEHEPSDRVVPGVVVNDGYGAPAVVRLDSNSSSTQYYDQGNGNNGGGGGGVGGHGYGPRQLGDVHQKGSLRLQTNIIPGPVPVPTSSIGQGPGNAYYEQLRLLEQQFQQFQQFQVQQLHGQPQATLQGSHQQQFYQPDAQNANVNTGAMNSYSYQLPSHLSPIEEKDYFSPVDSLRNTRSLIGSIRGIAAGRKGSSGNVNRSRSGSRNEDTPTVTGTTTRSGTGDSFPGSVGSGGQGPGLASRSGTGDSFPGSLTESRVNAGIGSRVGSRESTSTNVNFAGTERGIGGHGGDGGLGSTPTIGTPQLQNSPYTGHNPSPGGSIDGIRPPGPNPSPFLTRQINRTLSQTSSRTHASNGTSTPAIGSSSGPTAISPSTITAPTTNSPIPSVRIPAYIRQSQPTIIPPKTQTQTQNQTQAPTTPPPISPTHTHTSITSTVHTNGSHGTNASASAGTGTIAGTTLVGSNTSINLDQPPMIPPLDLRPHFPGPHPSYTGIGPPLRIRHGYGYGVGIGKVKVKGGSVPASVMPKIPGSHEGYYDEEVDDDDDSGSYKEDEYDDAEEGEEELDGDEGDRDLEMMMYESGMMTLTDGRVSLRPESYVGATRSVDEKRHDDGIDGKKTIRYGDEVRGKYWRQGEEQEKNVAGSSKVVLERIRDDYVDGADLEAGVSGQHSSNQRQRQQLLSNSDSFITRRWDRIHKSGIPTEGRMRQSIHTFRAKKAAFFMKYTPAYWAFWLGFMCPILWLVGGWHFTNFGEQPPKMSAWGFYFSTGVWKEMLCCCCFGMRRRRVKVPLVIVTDESGDGKGKGKGKGKEGNGYGGKNVVKSRRESIRSRLYPPLPKWVAEKQSTDDGRAKLNDPKRSMRGISFGYPFIPRLVTSPTRNESNRTVIKSLKRRVVGIATKPNRLLDQMYGVKLREVRGRPESGRRMFDPWIQRCRYAFCYALLIMGIALCTASTYLIVYNTRQLR